MFGMVHIVFLMFHLGLGGAFCILDVLSGIVDSEFDILGDISLLGVGIW